MTVEYGTIVTAIGLVKLTNAALLNEPLTLSKVKFGDSLGSEYTPDENCTDLKNVVHESNVIAYKENKGGDHWVTIESSIAYKFGPFWVRELGIYDTDGDLIFIEAVAPRFKPDSNGNSSVDMSFSTTVDIINNDSVDFIIDPHVAIATVKYVNDVLLDKVDKSSITNEVTLTSTDLVSSAQATNTVWNEAVAALSKANSAWDEAVSGYNLAASKWTYATATIGRYGAVLLSNSYTGSSQTKAVTEKALKDGLETKRWPTPAEIGLLTNAQNDQRFLGKNNKAVAAGTADIAVRLDRDRTNYVGFTDGAVVGQLGWTKHGNNHTIFDASSGKAPNGSAINNSNSSEIWSGTRPTLMGWNGQTTFGVRVDSARNADVLQGSTKAQIIASAVASKSSDAALFDGKPSTDFRKVSEGGLRTIARGQFNTGDSYYNALIARMATNTSQWSRQGPLIVELYNKYYNKGGYKKYLVQFGYKSAAARVVLVEAFGDSGKERLFAEAPVVISGTTRYVDIKLNTDKYSQTVIVIKTCATYNSNKNALSADQIYYPPMNQWEHASTTSFTPDEDLTVDRTLTTTGNLYERSNRVYSKGNKPTPADIGALAVNGVAKDSSKLNNRFLSSGPTGNTVTMRTDAGDINARLFKSTFPTQQDLHSGSAICFRNDSGTGNADNYMRFVSKAGFSRWLGAQRKITYGTGIPTASSGAQEGDVYIKYNQ